MTKHSVKKNYIYNLAYQLFAIIIPFVTAPYVSRVLGAENIGIYNYTVSVVTYFVLFGSLGMAVYGAREIAYVQNDKKKRSQIFWEINILHLIATLISTAVFLSTCQLFGNYWIYYLILSFYLFSTVFDISWFFQGMEDLKLTSIRNIIVRTIGVVLIFTFVKTSTDLWIYVLLFALTTFISNVSLWFRLPKYIEKVKLKELTLKKHLKPVLALFLPQIASQIYTVLDKVMIGAIIPDKAETGFYAQGERIIRMAITVIIAVSAAISPRIAAAFVNKDKTSLDRYMYKTFKFTFMLALPMIFGVLAVADRFVPIFYGPGYDRVAIVMKILSPIILIIGFGSAIGVQYFIPTKRQKQLTITYIAGATANVIANALLIGTFGAVGAAIGTICAEIIVTGLQLFFIRKEYPLTNIIKCCPKYLISSTIMFAVCFGLNIIMPAGSIYSIIVIIAAGGIIYGLSLLALKDEQVLEVANGFKNKLKSN